MENVGRGGSLNDEPESSNYSFTDVWQTWIGRRGDVARAMFYMDVRYEGLVQDNIGEPDLILTDDISQITGRDVWETGGDAFMGLLSDLLEWHHDDPVDDFERRRNTVVFLFQGNRNPFVDHPEWADMLFGDGGTTTGRAWINEFHYDNDGDDLGEFVEVAGTAGLDLTDWTLVSYNGNGGRKDRTVTLHGQIPSMQGGGGVLAFDFERLQNGSPDGIALVNASGTVVDLLGYEGGFTCVDGPAKHRVVDDIGVVEPDNTPIGQSLQLTGAGCNAGAFSWTGPASATRGAVNQGQTLSGCP